jgi:hypothetical protein
MRCLAPTYIVLVSLLLGGCPAAIGPAISPGLYAGNVTQNWSVSDTFLGYFDSGTDLIHFTIEFSENGIPKTRSGVEAAVGVTDATSAGGTVISVTVSSVSVTDNGVTITYSAQMSLSDLTLTGDGWEAYRVVGDNAVSYSTSATLADSANTAAYSLSAQGTLSR